MIARLTPKDLRQKSGRLLLEEDLEKAAPFVY